MLLFLCLSSLYFHFSLPNSIYPGFEFSLSVEVFGVSLLVWNFLLVQFSLLIWRCISYKFHVAFQLPPPSIFPAIYISLFFCVFPLVWFFLFFHLNITCIFIYAYSMLTSEYFLSCVLVLYIYSMHESCYRLYANFLHHGILKTEGFRCCRLAKTFQTALCVKHKMTKSLSTYQVALRGLMTSPSKHDVEGAVGPGFCGFQCQRSLCVIQKLGILRSWQSMDESACWRCFWRWSTKPQGLPLPASASSPRKCVIFFSFEFPSHANF